MKKEEIKTSDNSFGAVGVVLGILSITFSSIVGVVLGIIGLIFSIQQKKRMQNKWSKAGFVLNLIGIILGIVVFVLVMINFLNSPEFLNQIQQFQNAP